MNTIVKQSKIAGKGLFAAKNFKKGEVVIIWHPNAKNFKKGEVVIIWHPKILPDEEYAQLPKSEHHYIIKDKRQILLMQPPERYVNHSCDPNTKPVNRSDVAIRNIRAGEEITSDYLNENSVLFVCHCGAANCRSKANE